MENRSTKFGETLKRWREEADLTQEELAARIGKTKSYISNIERAQPHPQSGAPPKPSLEVIDGLAKALGKTATAVRDAAGYGLPKREALPVDTDDDEDVAALFYEYDKLTKQDKKEMKLILQMAREEIRKRLRKKK